MMNSAERENEDQVLIDETTERTEYKSKGVVEEDNKDEIDPEEEERLNKLKDKQSMFEMLVDLDLT